MSNNAERKPLPPLSRREFLKSIGVVGSGLVLESCRKRISVEAEKTSTFTEIPAPETLVPTLTPAPTETSQKTVVLTAETNLVNFAESYSQDLSDDDPYYPWYCLNGGEKLFDPWAIPAGTSLLIPEKNKELLAQCQKEVKEQDWQYILAENSTSLGQSSEARLRNIRTAVNRLNGEVVSPYELFSTLAAIGPLSEQPQGVDEGYGWGFGYTQEGEVKMFAGGICQVPSTLFKAVAQSGVLVVQRTAHLYYSANYGPWDATISEGVDFTFRNLFDFPVKIEAEIKENQVLTRIKSPQANPYDDITCETVYDRQNPDGSRDGLVRQTVVFKGRTRIREYPSHYEKKPG